MRKLVIAEPGLFLGVKEERIVVRRSGEVVAEVPAAQISHVFVSTRGASLSSAALSLLLRHGAQLVLLDGRGRPLGRLLPLMRRGLRAVEAQIEALKDERGAALAKAFASSKALNQAALIRSAAHNRAESNPQLARMLLEASVEIKSYAGLILQFEGRLEEIRPEIVRMEAAAADIYWKLVAELLGGLVDFPGRRKRFDEPKDPANLLLNYGYGILSSICFLALELSSLDPYRGFLHVNSPRRPALVMDLMEEFRQTVVDRVVFRLLRELDLRAVVGADGLTREARKALALKILERVKERTTFRGRSLPIEAHIYLQARRIRGFLLGHEPEYRGYVER